ncbi:MAG: qorA [Candidatus Saccharibacteria bacterium]|nr:qorA [Candidatus Saccharibacteria bacterium]
MKAAQITSYDGPEAVTVNDVETPELAPNQVLITAVAAGVNPFDWKVTLGYAKDWVPLTFPATLGGDVAGTISQLGAEVTGFEVGQAVYGSANSLSGNGAFAELVPVDSDKIAPAPASIDLHAAAGYPLAAASAYQSLVDTAKIQAGQKVLIHGGAGGIGSMAIQMAKNAGAYVATTAGAEDLDYVTSLGADEAIDYKSQDFSTLLTGYDVVFDTVGGETYKKSFEVLKEGGQLVSMVEQPDEALATEHKVAAKHMMTGASTATLTEITALIDAGKLSVNIDKEFPLDEAAAALAHSKNGHVRGKVIITIA